MIERIYESLSNDERSPFENTSAHQMFDNYIDKYVEIAEYDYDKRETLWGELMEIILLERRTAFEIGFASAMTLKKESVC